MSTSGFRSSVRAAVALGLVPIAAACPDDKAEVVTEIEIVPSKVAVASDAARPTRFELEARVWTGLESERVSLTEADGVKPTWSISPTTGGVHLEVAPSGYAAAVTMDAGAYPTAQVTVTAEAGGIGAHSLIFSSAGSGEDLVEGAHADGLAPGAVIAWGVRTDADAPCAVWLGPSMVRTGTAGNVTAECSGPMASWGLAVLDPAGAMGMYRGNWTGGLDKVPAAPVPAIRTIPLAMRVLVGSGPDLAARQSGAHAFAVMEIGDANTVLADNRVGIRLQLVNDLLVPPPGSDQPTRARSCSAGDALTKPLDYAGGVLHLYLIDDLGNADGFTCVSTDSRPYPVIYLRAGARSGVLLLHELGHALGLGAPGDGHADELPGFDAANVMVSGLAERDDVWRRRFTVGQALRMNADPASWLNWAKDLVGTPIRDAAAPRVECQCGGDDPAGVCPRVVDDIARARTGEGSRPPPRCGDLIALPALEADEVPVALVAGRPWRTAPGACHYDIAGHWLLRTPTHFIETENLTRAGTCASWLAVFFRNHAPIFRDLNTMGGVWSDGANVRNLDRYLEPRVGLTVHVYHDAGEKSEAIAGIEEAKEVYGPDGRTGLELNFERHETLPSPCPVAPAGEFAVCYSAASGTTVAQLVGAALGLSILTPAEQSISGFAHNVMQPGGIPTGERPTLTLGQLFHVHAGLRAAGLENSEFPDCRPADAPCPPPDADAKP